MEGHIAAKKGLTDCLPEDSWFRDYMECWPTAEAPKSFILLGAMSMLGAALGRKVWFDQDVHILYPMLNLLLIGPSGTGKSTAIKMAQKNLLERLPKLEQPQFINGATPEKLHDDLRANPHAVLFASELANFFTKQKYMESMIPYVTELLDYPNKLQRRTIGGGIVEVHEPSVSVVGGSTVEWLQGQLPDSATSGGFLARFLILSEESKQRRVAAPKHELSKAVYAKLMDKREDTFLEFTHLVASASGEIPYRDYAALDTYSYWYANHKPATGHLAPFAARAGEFVLRLAMLIAVSRHNISIAEEDVQAAIEIYDYTAAKLQSVVVPFTPQGKMMAMIGQAIGEDELTEVEVFQAMRNFIPANDVEKLLISMMRSKDIERTPGGKFKRVQPR